MTLFIEILDDTRLRLYHDEHCTTVTDAELPAYVQKLGAKIDMVLLDALHIQSKTFTRPVKDKKILAQVIAADMADYWIHDRSAYHFAYQPVASSGGSDSWWVSWIEKSRLQALQNRFADYQSRLVGLVSMPLLAALSMPATDDKDNDFILFTHEPLVYAVRGGQTTVLRSEQAQTWLASQSSPYQSIDLSQPANRQPIFQAAAVKSLPNLWHVPADTTPTALPYGRWALMGALAILLWAVNSYGDYQRAKTYNDQLLTAQRQLLQRVFPQANSSDPYGRLSAEHQRLRGAKTAAQQANNWLDKLDSALSQHDLTLTLLSVDLAAKSIRLGNTQKKSQDPVLDSNIQAALSNAGFTVQLNPAEAILTW